MKRYFLIICLFFLTGCTVRYHINYVGDDFIENISFMDIDKTQYDLIKNKTFAPIPAFYNSLNSVEQSVKIDGVEYYNAHVKNNIAYFDYKFDISNYKEAYSANICYDYFKVFESDNEIVISTDNKFKCFFPGRDLEKVDIVITTNHDVLYNNADEVLNGEYIWHITNENKESANIQISFSKDYEKSISDKIFGNNIVKILLISISIIIFGIILTIIIRIKYTKVNEI